MDSLAATDLSYAVDDLPFIIGRNLCDNKLGKYFPPVSPSTSLKRRVHPHATKHSIQGTITTHPARTARLDGFAAYPSVTEVPEVLPHRTRMRRPLPAACPDSPQLLQRFAPGSLHGHLP